MQNELGCAFEKGQRRGRCLLYRKTSKNSDSTIFIFPDCHAVFIGHHDLSKNHVLDHLQNHHGNHCQNHGEDHFGYHCRCLYECHFQYPLRPHCEHVFAIQNVSQTEHCGVMLWAMRRQKLDPKHVRDFFYRHALSVRLMTLFFDGIWWLITRGFIKSTRHVVRTIRRLLPFSFPVNERIRRLHTFIIGRTGSGKSVLLHNLIRHYLTKNTKPSVVVLDPHGDLARLVAMDKTNLKNDRLVLIRFDGIGQHHIHLNPFDLRNPSEHLLNRAQLQFAGAIEQIIGETFTPRQRTLIRACMGIMLPEGKQSRRSGSFASGQPKRRSLGIWPVDFA